MKWKILILWTLIFVGLCCFFLSFGISTLQRQEEMQLFIPEWTVIRNKVLVAGGFCTVAGQALTQYYSSPIFILSVNSVLLCSVGLLCYRLLQAIEPHGYNVWIALFPVFWLAKVHISPLYVVDGTIGILLLLLFSVGFISFQKTKMQMCYGLASMVFLYELAGQLVALYGLILVSISIVCRKGKWYNSFAACLLGLLLTYLNIRLAIGIPLTDGIYSERYQESQLQPDSYIYYIWIRFIGILLILFIVTFMMKAIFWRKRTVKAVTTSFWLICTGGFFMFCLPDRYDRETNQMNELSMASRRNDWDAIIRAHSKNRWTDVVSLTYLNMALAQKGLLGNKLFHFDQRGPQGLLAPWDRTYHMSCLLSDVHYMIGDISLSEGYAMEGLILAKRGGNPRMLQRLVEISLIRKDFILAEKYLNILGRLPDYRYWTRTYRGYIDDPERVKQDKDLSIKIFPPSLPDDLLCMFSLDSLWTGHLSEPGGNRTAWEYLGCSYLLAKDMEKFKALLLHTGSLSQKQSLPVHFQEAVSVLAAGDLSILNTVSVQTDILQRYKQFLKDLSMTKGSHDGLSRIYRQYGDTFWFYYYCKQLKR